MIIVGLILECKNEAGVSSGEASLVGTFAEEEIREKKVTTRLAGRSNSESA